MHERSEFKPIERLVPVSFMARATSTPGLSTSAGTNHSVLFTNVGFSPSDTTQAGSAIRAFFTTLNVNDAPAAISGMTAFPNPGNEILTVKLDLKSNELVNLQIVDLNGRLIQEISNEYISAGIFKKEINVSVLAPGFYMLKATVNNKSTFTKINITQ